MVHLRRLLVTVVAAVFVLGPLSASAMTVPPGTPDTVSGIRVSTPVTAGKGYTFWGFYAWDAKTSTWGFSPVGANDPKQLPEDGDVYGFRWALVVGTDERLPRADGDFESICADEQAGDGEKRIAFVLDYGTTTDADESDDPPEPRGVCASVDTDFTVQQALQSVVSVRTDASGLICGIDRFPSNGCGEQLTGVQAPPADEPVTLALPSDEPDQPDATTADDEPADGSGGMVTIIVALVVVAALVVGGLVLRQRRR